MLILDTFRVLEHSSEGPILVEWSLAARDPSVRPHVLAALVQAALECCKAKSFSNVRIVLTPKRLSELALAFGWQVKRTTRVPGGEGSLDGQCKVSTCLASAFTRQIYEHASDGRERGVILALSDACEVSLEVVLGIRSAVQMKVVRIDKSFRSSGLMLEDFCTSRSR
ncbi:hypothetical protein HBI25_118640 [Parastagonospora nodorum]|nr:hypothetical protein HBI10_130840 [Parastagonospora nodorum]KAH4030092.1 hypothetical protein HBI13_036750 [Parastagonospora nodorum]KAH4076510.1 hypothetical protein HBH50_006680 [Parastagonospora nodorum]KAH4096008.1 hypothetical protein HBH48_051120 [Parastagonospora nodorum]KAH4169388.1 hypothetical protein HBH43_116670 [Parastagonospora nodorum]